MSPRNNKRTNKVNPPASEITLRKENHPVIPTIVNHSHPSREETYSTICTICAENATDWAFGNCSHVVCGNCFHRMRVLYDRNECVICKALLTQVVCIPLNRYSPGMTFEEAVALPGAFHDKQVNIWFLNRLKYQRLHNVRSWKCSHKACKLKPNTESVFVNADRLRTHVKAEHRCVYCNLCFNGRKSFVSEIDLYPLDRDRNFSSRQRAHMRKQHPQCKFCRSNFLDDDAIYLHLQEKHETCTVCERNGHLHEYYVNFEQLLRHYEREHYVCEHETCRGVVYATNIELQAHSHTRHGDNSRGVRSRTLRVNLQDLHRDSNRQRRHTAPNDHQEQERQAARRRAFLSSNVVFSGALNFDDTLPENHVASASTVSAETTNTTASVQSSTTAAGAHSREVTTTASENSEADGSALTRRPDDGRFHPLALPHDAEERQARNVMLVKTMRSLLEPAEYEEFRYISAEFRNGNKTAEEYYDSVVDAFGVRAAVRDILPELVALLPTPLLQAPLLQISLRRTQTPGSEAGYLGPSGSAGTSKRDSNAGDQFPTLSDAPPPLQVATKTRRFGALGPDEFPRLGRVKRVDARPRPSPQRSSSSAAPRPSPRPIATPTRTTPLQEKTVASVLRENTGNRIFGKSRPQIPASNAKAPVSANLPPSAFPSLSSMPSASTSISQASSNRNPQPRSRAVTSQTKPSFSDFPSLNAPSGSSSSNSAPGIGSAIAQPGEAPSTDVSLRPGAVWGGSGTVVRHTKRRGISQGRRPATPPKSVFVRSSSDIPNFRASGMTITGGASSSTGEHQAENVRSSNRIIDVTQIAKSRREALQKSSVPKIGSSGYGFAWDRKKAQQKKKEIKSSMNSNSAKNGNSS